jgi:hypothetical protein
MLNVDVQLHCPIHDSFRVRQIAGMFDLSIEPDSREAFRAELPDLTDPWQIGVIVGPSGSGKTSTARAAFGTALYNSPPWPAQKAVIDSLGNLPIKQITRTLTAVGFSSPRAWIKPHAVLSNGEKFRCELARALLGPEDARVPLSRAAETRSGAGIPACCESASGGIPAPSQFESARRKRVCPRTRGLKADRNVCPTKHRPRVPTERHRLRRIHQRRRSHRRSNRLRRFGQGDSIGRNCNQIRRRHLSL